MNTTYSIEMRREKFAHVTGRRNSGIIQISICPEQVDITELPMLECSLDSTITTEHPHMLRRSLAKYNLVSPKRCTVESSIISTAEGHFKSGMSKRTTKLRDVKPKRTSSVISMKTGNQDQITFHVECASTPTKSIKRSSTPKSLVRMKKNILTSTVIEKRSLKSELKDLSAIKENVVSLKRSKMSSCNSSTPKRLKKSKKMHFSEFISSTGVSNEINLDQHQFVEARPVRRDMNERNLQKKEWKKLKYPIKYYPNMKVKDIDRNFADMYDGSSIPSLASSFEYNLRPSNSCYSYGDYKFWIV